MGGHVVLSVKFLMTHGARIGLTLEVGCHVVPVEVGGVGVGVVAHLAAVVVPVLDAEAAYTDGGGGLGRGVEAEAVLVEVGQLCLHLLLELVGHQVGRGTGGPRLGVHAESGAARHLNR